MKNQTKIEEVTHVDISLIDDFEGHPFTVKDDESMVELTRRIEENGVLNPIIVRKKDGGRYEIIAGHRRKRACLLLEMMEIPVIIREQKGNQKEKIIVPMERLQKYFSRGASPKQMEETIIKALEFYRKRRREDREER